MSQLKRECARVRAHQHAVSWVPAARVAVVAVALVLALGRAGHHSVTPRRAVSSLALALAALTVAVVCPGARAVATIVRGGGDRDGLRFLRLRKLLIPSASAIAGAAVRGRDRNVPMH